MTQIFLIIFFILSAAFHQPLYFLMPILTIVYFQISKDKSLAVNSFNKVYISLFIVILLFFIIHSIANFSVEWYSTKGVLRYLAYAMFAIMAYKFSINEIDNYFKNIALLLIILVPVTFFLTDYQGRYQSIFRHANHLAYVAVILLYFLVKHKPFKLILNYAIVASLLGILFLTKTSGAFLILVLLIAYNFLFSPKVKLKHKIIVIFGPLLLIIPIALQFSDKIYEQIDSLEYLNKDFIMQRVYWSNPGGYGSFIWRVVYWTQIYVAFIRESTFNILFGIGIDSLTKGNMPYKFMYTDPHNDFLKVLVEYGYIGLLLFFNFLKNIFFMLKKNVSVLILFFVPFMFDNAIVNFSFNMTIILLVAYEYKKIHIANNP